MPGCHLRPITNFWFNLGSSLALLRTHFRYWKLFFRSLRACILVLIPVCLSLSFQEVMVKAWVEDIHSLQEASVLLQPLREEREKGWDFISDGPYINLSILMLLYFHHHGLPPTTTFVEVNNLLYRSSQKHFNDPTKWWQLMCHVFGFFSLFFF